MWAKGCKRSQATGNLKSLPILNILPYASSFFFFVNVWIFFIMLYCFCKELGYRVQLVWPDLQNLSPSRTGIPYRSWKDCGCLIKHWYNVNEVHMVNSKQKTVEIWWRNGLAGFVSRGQYNIFRSLNFGSFHRFPL